MTATTPAPVDIAISGGGFAGLSLALAFARTIGPELSIAVVEPGRFDAAPATDPRASAISASSRRLLTAIGVWYHVEPEAQPVHRIEITDTGLDAGIRPVLLSYDNTVGPHSGDAEHDREPATHILPNAALLAALITEARTEPGIRLVEGAAVTGLETTSADARLTLSTGETIAARLVIAADGRRSALRDLSGIKVVGWSYGQSGIVTRVAHERPHNATAVQHFLPAGPFAILPLPGNRSCITWSEEAGRAHQLMALDDDGFLDELDRRFGGRLGALSLDGARKSWPLEMHLARSYIAPRLALAGDAAHGVHPIAGQGLNLAMRDIAALVECVTEALRAGLDAGDAYALERYQRWRRFDSMTSAATFDALNRFFSNDVPLLRSVREVGLGLVDRVPALKSLLVTEAAGLAGTVPRLLHGELPG